MCPEILDKVSRELNLPKDLISKTYTAYWLFIKKHIQALPLKEDLTEEEFFKLKTSFNIPSIGKLNCTYDRMINTKKRFNLIKQIREKRND